MAKKKKKDPAKKFALQAAKEAKADKKAQKRLQKEARREEANSGGADDDGDDNSARNESKNNEDDLDALLDSFKKQSIELSTPLVEVIGSHPEGNANNQQNSSSSVAESFPYPPRGNFSLTLCPTTNDMFLFGGEFFNGVENVVFDEILLWDPDGKPATDDEETKKNHKHGIWKRIISPQPRPPPRCSHSTVYYNNALYIFGGELATAQNYLHYKDIWKFDIKTNLWTEIKPRNKGGPTARSGHRAIVWRHYMLIFGGFFEAVREAPRWFNDLNIYDFSTNSWIECSYSKLASIPPERSACNFGIFTGGTDVAYVSGGYSKLKNPAPGSKAEGRVHTDYWALHLKGLESGKPPSWERISRKGEYPSQRSGTACTIWKNKMLVFGGVDDEETENHRVKSVFFDDLFAFDMERKRWFRLSLKKKAGERRRRKKNDDKTDSQIDAAENQVADEESDEDNEGIEGEATSNGWDLDMLRSNMFAFIDGEGNVVYEKIEEEDEDMEQKEANSSPANTNTNTNTNAGYDADEGENLSSKVDADDDEPNVNTTEELVQKMAAPIPANSYLPTIAKSEVMALGEDGNPTPIRRQSPLPRIKAQIVVRGNTLFLYGGILEVGDREVTLDDVWSLELQKREEWVCIHEGTMHKQVWKGVDSDNESYISTDRGGDESDDDDDDFFEFDDILEEGEDEEAAKAARKAAKKAAKKERMKGIREEIKSLNEQLHSDDSNEDPLVGEELADFYSRTSAYWTQKAMESSANSDDDDGSSKDVKELKREGFKLAQERYISLKPVLYRLRELEMEQEGKEESKDKKKKSKKEKKEKKKDRRR